MTEQFVGILHEREYKDDYRVVVYIDDQTGTKVHVFIYDEERQCGDFAYGKPTNQLEGAAQRLIDTNRAEFGFNDGPELLVDYADPVQP